MALSYKKFYLLMLLPFISNAMEKSTENTIIARVRGT